MITSGLCKELDSVGIALHYSNVCQQQSYMEDVGCELLRKDEDEKMNLETYRYSCLGESGNGKKRPVKISASRFSTRKKRENEQV